MEKRFTEILMIEPEDERAILIRASHGDRNSYALLYTRYLSELCRYVYLFTRSKEESEEVVQDVFVRIWEKKENLATVQSFQAYLFRSAKNLLVDQFRRKETESRIMEVIRPVSEESKDHTDSEVICNQYNEIAARAKDILSPKRKQIFEMSFEEGLSLDEISGRLAISKTVVKKQLYSATDFIRGYLRKHGEITSELVIFITLFCHSL